MEVVYRLAVEASGDADDSLHSAAAAEAEATILLTTNLKDFPIDDLQPCVALHPESPNRSNSGLQQLGLRSPPPTAYSLAQVLLGGLRRSDFCDLGRLPVAVGNPRPLHPPSQATI